MIALLNVNGRKRKREHMITKIAIYSSLLSYHKHEWNDELMKWRDESYMLSDILLVC